MKEMSKLGISIEKDNKINGYFDEADKKVESMDYLKAS